MRQYENKKSDFLSAYENIQKTMKFHSHNQLTLSQRFRRRF